MAFEHKIKVDETSNCKEINLFEETGNYNITTNPTGYGAPNVASSAIVSQVIKFLKYGTTTPVIFTFTIAANVITAATRTATDGTVTNILADLASTAFPIAEADPFVITGEYLTEVADSDIDSDAYYIESTVSTSTVPYTFTVDQLLTCSACCCVASAQADLKASDCKCDPKKAMNAFYARVYLDAAVYAMEREEVDEAHNNIVEAKERCQGNCTTC